MGVYKDELSLTLDQKLKAYDLFLSATVLLQKALEIDNVDEVGHLVEQREELMRYIEGLESRIESRRNADKEYQGKDTEGQAPDIYNDLMEKLKQIMSVDKDCLTIATQRRDVAGKDMTELNGKKDGLKKYGRNVQHIPKFIRTQT